ncbi:MAG: flavodoxin family protein [Desulfobacteraceae bacterium]|nr:flavodoxin family protein [Desulfobacteraceae bacterium]
MKILGVSSGTKDGNNDAMCREALMGAQENGAEIEFVRLLDLDIKHCTGCISCVMSLMKGKGNKCALKDDFDWLLDKILEADGVLFSTPVFEKGAAGIFRTITDRFGPRMDRLHNIVSTEIAEKNNGKIPDPRILKDKVVSYVGIGGSDWTNRIQCDHGLLAMTMMWKVIDNEVFPWSKGIIMEDEKVARAHEIGVNLAKAARDIESAEYKGDPGICPHCHSRNFYLNNNASEAICCLCGIKGEIKNTDGKISFVFPEEQLEHAHDTISGKKIHMDDIKKNEDALMASRKSQEYKARVEKYRNFINASKPETNKMS